MKPHQSARADFTQVVTTPAKDGPGRAPENLQRQFRVPASGPFSLCLSKPFRQTIVADGQTLWFYDVDLNRSPSAAI